MNNELNWIFYRYTHAEDVKRYLIWRAGLSVPLKLFKLIPSTHLHYALGQRTVILFGDLCAIWSFLENRWIIVYISNVYHNRCVILLKIIGRCNAQLVLSKTKRNRMVNRAERNDWLQFTYFLDFLIIECTGYKNETRRVVDAKRSTGIAAGYFILNRRCWNDKRRRRTLLALCTCCKCNGMRIEQHFWTSPRYGQSHIIPIPVKVWRHFCSAVEQQLKLNSIVKANAVARRCMKRSLARRLVLFVFGIGEMLSALCNC